MTAIPLLGDVSLDYAQRIEHHLDAGFHPLPVAGLEGTVQQRAARPSHRVRVVGLLMGEDAAGALEALQQAASSGEELTFTADITTALELAAVVITRFRAVEAAGAPGRYAYDLQVVESPPLPPPAAVEPFGGLEGAGDLGFDTDIAGDLQGIAEEAAAAVDQAQEVLGTLDALSGLADLQLGGVLQPLGERADSASRLGERFSGALRVLNREI